MQRFRIVGCALLVGSLLGCGGPAPAKLAATVPIRGTVNLDGNPLADGEISFSMQGEPQSVLPIKNGAFSGDAYLGKNRVEVSAFKAGPVNPDALSTDEPPRTNIVGARFNSESSLTAEVSKAGPNEFKFDVQSQ